MKTNPRHEEYNPLCLIHDTYVFYTYGSYAISCVLNLSESLAGIETRSIRLFLHWAYTLTHQQLHAGSLTVWILKISNANVVLLKNII